MTINNITSYKNIVILSGAGVSTNAGIPDYRSRDGIFAKLSQKYSLSDPASLFNRKFVNTHPQILNDDIMKEFWQQMADAKPTDSHILAKWLYDRGILRRVYTQNIDGLYRKTGLPSDKIVEFHGNYGDGSMVLYGDPIPNTVLPNIIEDFVKDQDIDLLIVMGSSLQVAPFCALPNLVTRNCTRILVDINPENAMVNPWSKKTTNIYGLYSDHSELCSWTKFGKRRVSLRPQWKSGKYKEEYIIQIDCDEWSKSVME